MPPTRIALPSMSRRLTRMEPMSEAWTMAIWFSLRAILIRAQNERADQPSRSSMPAVDIERNTYMKMMTSDTFPRLIFIKAPTASPRSHETFSVPTASRADRGTMASAFNDSTIDEYHRRT